MVEGCEKVLGLIVEIRNRNRKGKILEFLYNMKHKRGSLVIENAFGIIF
jgi:hypothetical protein